MLKTAHIALALSLLLPLAPALDAAASSPSSFSHGFSSHTSSSHASAPRAPAAKPSSGFGSFSRRQAAAPAPDNTSSASSAVAPSRPGGGFGSFGSAPATPKQSDSALSQQLSKQSAEANALRTLDQRNAAKAAQNAPQPVPGYGPSGSASMPPAGMQGPAPAAPPTVVVHQDGGGLGHVIAGAMIARSMNAHANSYPQGGYNNGYNGGYNNGAGHAAHGGTSFFSLFVTLCILVAIAWGLWFAWRGWRRRRAAQLEADKPNYSFERN